MGAMFDKNQPSSWDDLLHYDMTKVTDTLGREPYVLSAYADHKFNLSEQGLSIIDYIYETVLGDEKFALEVNKFPYWIEHGITHYVFWMRPECKLPMIEVKKKLEKEFMSDIIIFENDPSMQSVQLIPHYHVFVYDINL